MQLPHCSLHLIAYHEALYLRVRLYAAPSQPSNESHTFAVQRAAVNNYALYTQEGAVSFGDNVTIRGAKGLTVGGDVAVNGDLNMAAGKSVKGAFKASNGSAGVSGSIVIPKLTTGGANGSITVADGIITAFTNPT